MGRRAAHSEPECRLCFYWNEYRPEERPDAMYWQVAGCIERLLAVREGLVSARRLRRIDKALRQVELQHEIKMVRCFELRDRVIALLGEVTGSARAARAIKSVKDRVSALEELGRSHRLLAEEVVGLVSSLDREAGARNQHTHEQFLTFGLYVGDELFDPYDVLEQTLDASLRRRLVSYLREHLGHRIFSNLLRPTLVPRSSGVPRMRWDTPEDRIGPFKRKWPWPPTLPAGSAAVPAGVCRPLGVTPPTAQ